MDAVPLFEVWQSAANRQWYFRLKSPNNENICNHEGYTTCAAAELGLTRVKAYAPAAPPACCNWLFN